MSTTPRLATTLLSAVLALCAAGAALGLAGAPAASETCAGPLVVDGSDPFSCPICGGSMDDFEAVVRVIVGAHVQALAASRAG